MAPETVRGISRSALWAAGISIPLSIWGASASMAIVHAGGPLLILFAPVIPVMLLFGSDGVFATAPDWLFNAFAVLAQFLGTFAVVHLVRWLRRKDDA